MTETTDPRDSIISLHEDGMTLGDIAAHLGYRYDGETLRLPITVAMADEGEHADFPGLTGAQAAQEYVDTGEWGDQDESFAVTVHTWTVGFIFDDCDDLLKEVQVDEDSHLVVKHPEEPQCLGGHEHAWKEVSLQSHGAGVRTTNECKRCGAVEHYRSCSQGEYAETEHDHETYRYEVGKTPQCACPCGCSNDAVDLDEGEPVCAECQEYTTTEDGEIICSAATNGFTECHQCHDDIDWGGIVTGAPGSPNTRHGTCECAKWTNEENGGNWDRYAYEANTAGAA